MDNITPASHERELQPLEGEDRRTEWRSQSYSWLHTELETSVGYMQAGELHWLIWAGAALAEWFSALLRQLSAAWNSSFRGYDTFFWPLQTPSCTHTHTYTHRHVCTRCIHIIKNKNETSFWKMKTRRGEEGGRWGQRRCSTSGDNFCKVSQYEVNFNSLWFFLCAWNRPKVWTNMSDPVYKVELIFMSQSP